jgi:molecular chaperone DnaK
MTRMPKIQDTVQKFFGKEPHKGVNPDEVVAVGAAIQAGILSGDVKDVLLLDVTPLSLGVETLGGVMTKLIERNTTIPTKKQEVFSTAADSQPSVEIHVLQGEREMAKDNRTLGKFHLVGIPPAPRGVPQVEVTFDIDANGILNVSAKDRATGKTQNITITSSSGLNKDEVEKMVKEAQAHSEEDKKRREMVDLRNQADSLAYNLEKLLADNKDKIDAGQAKEIEEAVAETRKAMEGEDAEALKKALERVTSLSHRVAESLYKAAGPQSGEGNGPSGPSAGGAAPSGSGKPADDVVDAEYTVKE